MPETHEDREQTIVNFERENLSHFEIFKIFIQKNVRFIFASNVSFRKWVEN